MRPKCKGVNLQVAGSGHGQGGGDLDCGLGAAGGLAGAPSLAGDWALPKLPPTGGARSCGGVGDVADDGLEELR